ncbi:MAG TPA: phosphatase PAP2 family protein [Mycobacteriales bacterium]|nr:phosphatase PAP2 family protein [Mycobacteriales bacterium]
MRSSNRPAPVWVVALALLVGAWVTADVLLDGPLRHFDHRVSRWMLATGIRDTDWPKPLFAIKLGVYVTTKLGAKVPMLALTVPAVGWLAWSRRSWRPVLLTGVLLVLIGGTVQQFKHEVGRAMPAVDGLHLTAGRSFPSGHMTVAVVLWGLLAYLAAQYRLDRRLVWALGVLRWLAPAATMAAMLLLDYHWLTDLIAGLALGIVLLRVGYELDTRALRNWSGVQRPRRRVGTRPEPARPADADFGAVGAGGGGADHGVGVDGQRAAGG